MLACTQEPMHAHGIVGGGWLTQPINFSCATKYDLV